MRSQGWSRGSSTGHPHGAGDRIYLHLLLRPYDTVSVRGLPIRRVRAVRVLGLDRTLDFTTRAPIVESLFSADPVGEIIIAVPAEVVDPYATVLTIDIDA